MLAALRGQTQTVKTLLESKVDVNAKDSEGRTALMLLLAICRRNVSGHYWTTVRM